LLFSTLLLNQSVILLSAIYNLLSAAIGGLLPFTFNLLPLCLIRLKDAGRRHALCAVRLTLCTTLFCLYLLLSTASAEDVTLTWDANNESTVTGYILYYGTSSRIYADSVDVGNKTSSTITGLQDGVTYYFAVTAYDSTGLESAFSEELAYTTKASGSGNIDSDNDGMPDEWEILHGLDPQQDDASLDPDADGISNLQEYLGGTDPGIFEEFLQPEQPAILAPSNDDIVSLTPVLKTDAFYDPDALDVHTASEWQIIRTEDQVIVYDKVSYSALTTLTMPKLVLEGNTTYEWQVKFIDNHGLSSEWSESGTFTTGDDAADADGNGIPDDQEVVLTLDLDADGTPDSDQSDIKCVEIQEESSQIGISIRESDTVLSITAIESESPAEHLPPVGTAVQQANLTFGLISFRLIVDAPGDEAVVTLHLSRAAVQDSIWYKYDPVDNVWYDYSDYTEFSADRKKVYLTLVDGGFGDADGIANGIIVDPLALIESSSSAAATDAGTGGGGSGAGCFVSASARDFNTTGKTVIRQKIVEIAFVLTALLLIVFLNLGLKKLLSNRVR
jgi:chitinase